MKESESKQGACVCIFEHSGKGVCVSMCVVDSHAGISSLGKEHILF